jgi:hypothetical protein
MRNSVSTSAVGSRVRRAAGGTDRLAMLIAAENVTTL